MAPNEANDPIQYKGKGATHDPNNWRGICLKEMSTKIVSSIIAHKLLAILKHRGCLNQFRHVGCQEALHTVKQVGFWTVLTVHSLDHGLDCRLDCGRPSDC